MASGTGGRPGSMWSYYAELLNVTQGHSPPRETVYRLKADSFFISSEDVSSGFLARNQINDYADIEKSDPGFAFTDEYEFVWNGVVIFFPLRAAPSTDLNLSIRYSCGVGCGIFALVQRMDLAHLVIAVAGDRSCQKMVRVLHNDLCQRIIYALLNSTGLL